MTAGEASCKDGGVIIIAASCKEGHGGQALYEAFKNMESPQKILDDIHGVPSLMKLNHTNGKFKY